MCSTKLLDSPVCTPGEFKGHVYSSLPILHSSVSLYRDTIENQLMNWLLKLNRQHPREFIANYHNFIVKKRGRAILWEHGMRACNFDTWVLRMPYNLYIFTGLPTKDATSTTTV